MQRSNNYSKLGLNEGDDQVGENDEHCIEVDAADGRGAYNDHHHLEQLRRSILSPSRPMSPYGKFDSGFQRVETDDMDEDDVEDISTHNDALHDPTVNVDNGTVSPTRDPAQDIQSDHYTSNITTTAATVVSSKDSPPDNPFLEDDDSDDEEDLGRYNFDFNHTLGINNPYHQSNTSSSSRNLFGNNKKLMSGGENNGFDQTPHRSGTNLSRYTSNHDYTSPTGSQRQSVDRNPFTRIRNLMEVIKLMRMESRRKRMEFLLSLPEDDNYSSRCHYFATKVMIVLSSSWCDMMDKGFILIIFFTLAFVLIYESLDEEEDRDARRLLLELGLPALVLRVVWRPLYWFVWGRRIERKRKNTLELYDELNGEHGTRGLAIEIPHTISSEESDASDALDDDDTVNLSNKSEELKAVIESQ